MVRIKVSYERPEELAHLLAKLHPEVKQWKAAGKQTGRFKRAYIEIKARR